MPVPTLDRRASALRARQVPAILTVALVAGCASSSGPRTLSDEVADERDRYAAISEQLADGKAAVEKGRKLIKKGRKQVRDGEDNIESGEALVARGEQMVRDAERAYARARQSLTE